MSHQNEFSELAVAQAVGKRTPLQQKKSATKIMQGPGGTQSFSLFAEPKAEESQGKEPAKRNSIVIRKDCNAMSESQQNDKKLSRVVRQDSATFKSDYNSPFSKETRQETPKAQPKVNIPSQDAPWSTSQQAPQQQYTGPSPKANVQSTFSPFNKDGPQDMPQQRKVLAGSPKANISDKSSPFSQNYEETPQRKVLQGEPKANVQSMGSPFTHVSEDQVDQAIASTQQRGSIKIKQTPGGTQNINLFDAFNPPAPAPKMTPTYGYAQGSPFSNEPMPERPQSRSSRSGEMSRDSPWTAQDPSYVPPQRSSSLQFSEQGPKANQPSASSPFNRQPSPRRASKTSQGMMESQDHPLRNDQPNREAPKKAHHAFKVQQAPGGNQSFNILSHQ